MFRVGPENVGSVGIPEHNFFLCVVCLYIGMIISSWLSFRDTVWWRCHPAQGRQSPSSLLSSPTWRWVLESLPKGQKKKETNEIVPVIGKKCPSLRPMKPWDLLHSISFIDVKRHHLLFTHDIQFRWNSHTWTCNSFDISSKTPSKWQNWSTVLVLCQK